MVEPVHHVAVADPMFQVDKRERPAEAAVAEDPPVGTVDAVGVEHVTQAPTVLGDRAARAGRCGRRRGGRGR